MTVHFGVDAGNYPTVKQFIFGINLISVIYKIVKYEKESNIY